MIDFNVSQIESRFKSNFSNAQKRLDSQVLKDSNLYAPKDVGTLIDESIIGTEIGSGLIVWSSVYAKAQYNGLPNKSKDKNPLARSKWFEYAKKVNSKQWERLANDGFHNRS